MFFRETFFNWNSWKLGHMFKSPTKNTFKKSTHHWIISVIWASQCATDSFLSARSFTSSSNCWLRILKFSYKVVSWKTVLRHLKIHDFQEQECKVLRCCLLNLITYHIPLKNACLPISYYIPFWSLNLETSNILNSPLPLLSPYSLF